MLRKPMVTAEELEELLEKIAHEVRNPLTAATSSAELLEDKYPELIHERYLQIINQNLKYLAQLTQNFTTFLVEHRFDPSTFYFDAVVKEIALSFAASIAEQDIEFTSKIDFEDFSFWGDSIQMQQLFRNLLQNAAEAITDHGEVFLHVFSDGDNVIVDITDTGCGIDEELLPQIFNIHVSSKKDHGKGQGLPICKEIVKMHKGLIEVISTSSEGTTFRVTLPTKNECTEESDD